MRSENIRHTPHPSFGCSSSLFDDCRTHSRERHSPLTGDGFGVCVGVSSSHPSNRHSSPPALSWRAALMGFDGLFIGQSARSIDPSSHGGSAARAVWRGGVRQYPNMDHGIYIYRHMRKGKRHDAEHHGLARDVTRSNQSASRQSFNMIGCSQWYQYYGWDVYEKF